MSNPLRFDGRIAVVTGGGQGLGEAYALLLGRLGATVVVNDRPDSGVPLGISSRAERTATAVIAAGGKAIAIGGDVTVKEAMDALVAETVARFEQIDILISNAGTAGYIPFNEMTLGDFDSMLRVHMHGAFLLTRAAWPHMLARRYGRIVLTASSGMLGLENQAHYAAAKGGVAGLARALSVDGRPYGIAANVIMPLADTPLARQVSSTSAIGADSAKTTAALASLAAGPDLVAPVVAWLSHESCSVSGELLQAGMGRMCRVVAAHSKGFADAKMSVESVRDNWSEAVQCSAGEFPDLNAALQFQIQGSSETH